MPGIRRTPLLSFLGLVATIFLLQRVFLQSSVESINDPSSLLRAASSALRPIKAPYEILKAPLHVQPLRSNDEGEGQQQWPAVAPGQDASWGGSRINKDDESRRQEQQQQQFKNPPAQMDLSALIEAEAEQEARQNDLQLREGRPLRLCPDCDCKKAGSFAASRAALTPLVSREELRGWVERTGSFHNPKILKYLLHHILLLPTLEGLFTPEDSIAWLLTAHMTCPDTLISYDFKGLELDKPTSYVYTRTGPGGKLSEWEKRSVYMERHVQMFKDYQDRIDSKGFMDGTRADDRQLLWLVIEDEAMMEPHLEELLRKSGRRGCDDNQNDRATVLTRDVVLTT